MTRVEEQRGEMHSSGVFHAWLQAIQKQKEEEKNKSERKQEI